MRSRRAGCVAATLCFGGGGDDGGDGGGGAGGGKRQQLVVCGGFGTSSTASGVGRGGSMSGIVSTAEVRGHVRCNEQ